MLMRSYFALGLFSTLLGLSQSAWANSEASQQQRQYANKFGKVNIEALLLADGQREFSLQSNAVPLKSADGSANTEPVQTVKTKTLSVSAGDLQVRSQNVLFDALFSLAQLEKNQNSVNEITDWGFNDQQAVPCPCFETGAKWHYVWTRDLSYSLDLGLGYLDAERARNSLLFKTSKVRPELVARQVSPIEVALQDTGSGGSWPVSSDRVVWILAASGLTLNAMADSSSTEAQQAWQAQWYPIAKNTLLQDRQYIFSEKLGLYRGETSFLDWREQNYPDWTAKDTRFLAQSYALSTNVLHYAALKAVAEAAKTQEPAAAAQFARWADELKTAINQSFWLAEQGLYASYLGEEFNPMPVQQYDLLGLALAINHQVASNAQADQILQNYPLTQAGPPVFFPAKQQTPIYHNRANWPFVSAYALRAAKSRQHAELFHKIAMSLFQGAAFNLSNMENLEWLSQKAHVDDGELSGPVINSERQLWSVAAYHDFIVNSLFGVAVSGRTLVLNPYIPAQLAQDLQLGNELKLENLRLGSNTVQLTLQLQGKANKQQSYQLSEVRINGVVQALTSAHQLQLQLDDFSTEQNQIEMVLTPVAQQQSPVRMLKVADNQKLSTAEQRALFAPKQPLLSLTSNDKGETLLKFDANSETKTRFTLYKNGAKVHLKKQRDHYLDKDRDHVSQCYALVQSYTDTALTSLPSRTVCTAGQQQQFVAGDTLQSDDLTATDYLGLPVFKNWGLPEQKLQLSANISHSGTQRLALEYFIDNGPVNTGITAVVKQLQVQCPELPMQQSTLVMPHLATATEAGLSTVASFEAKAGTECKISIVDGFNMSYLQHFALYTGGKGGQTGPLNQAVIHKALLWSAVQ